MRRGEVQTSFHFVFSSSRFFFLLLIPISPRECRVNSLECERLPWNLQLAPRTDFAQFVFLLPSLLPASLSSIAQILQRSSSTASSRLSQWIPRYSRFRSFRSFESTSFARPFVTTPLSCQSFPVFSQRSMTDDRMRMTAPTSSSLIRNGRDSFSYERSSSQSEMVIARTRKDRNDSTANNERLEPGLEGQEERREVC